MMSITLLFSILLVIVILGMFTFKTRKKSILNMTSNVHFTIFTGFIALVFVLAIIAELRYPSSEASYLPPQTSSEEGYIEEDIFDSERLLTTRTHAVGNQLTIDYLPVAYGEPEIWIERKDVNDGLVEEFIYKPMLITYEYDMSDVMNTPLPEWVGETVTFFERPSFELTFSYFTNNFLVNQFKDDPIDEPLRNYGSFHSSEVIRLVVPMDLEIIDASGYVNFIEENE